MTLKIILKQYLKVENKIDDVLKTKSGLTRLKYYKIGQNQNMENIFTRKIVKYWMECL